MNDFNISNIIRLIKEGESYINDISPNKVILIGKTGSGKTTLLSYLSGLNLSRSLMKIKMSSIST
jgi:ABC-type lipoprotein export system ATPase subunit